MKIPIAMDLLNLERTTEDNEFVKGLYSWQAAEGPASKSHPVRHLRGHVPPSPSTSSTTSPKP